MIIERLGSFYQSNNTSPKNDRKALDDLEIIEKIDNVVDSALETEFNDIFKELTQYQLQLTFKYALLTDQNLILFKDIHMQEEHCRFALNTVDFIDLGLVL